jgi:hypothetical protein
MTFYRVATTHLVVAEATAQPPSERPVARLVVDGARFDLWPVPGTEPARQPWGLDVPALAAARYEADTRSLAMTCPEGLDDLDAGVALVKELHARALGEAETRGWFVGQLAALVPVRSRPGARYRLRLTHNRGFQFTVCELTADDELVGRLVGAPPRPR